MYYLYVFLIIVTTKTNAETVEEAIVKYFESDEVAKLREMWDKFRKPLENAISVGLQDSIGMKGLNVLVNKRKDPFKLATGFYHDDQRVQLILTDLYLEEIPRLWHPGVSFSLGSNIIKLESYVAQIVLSAQYLLHRNKSDIIYKKEDQDDSKTSPFLFETVQPTGQIAVRMDRCFISGYAMAMLSGNTVNLGHAHLKLGQCQYSLEIFNFGFGSPPVIAKYLPVGNGLGLNQLVMEPIYHDLMPKLQATMFSFINTSYIFDNQLSKFRERQLEIIKITAKYLTDIIRHLNRLIIERNNGHIDLEDHVFNWDDTGSYEIENGSAQIKLTDMVLTGLDTVYSGHEGGPYKRDDLKIGEEIRFSSIQIRGKVHLVQVPRKDDNFYEFAAELTDVEIELEMKVQKMETQSRRDEEKAPKPVPEADDGPQFEIIGIRNLVFSMPGVVMQEIEPMITGYLLSEVPKQLRVHLELLFGEAITEAKKGLSKDKMYSLYSGSTENDFAGLLSKGEKTVMEIDLHKPDFDQLRSKAKGGMKPGKHVKAVLKRKPIKPAVRRTKNFNNKINV